MDIQIFQTTDDLNRSFTEWLKEKRQKGDHDIASQGGSTPKSLFDYWGACIGEIEWAKIKIFWGDERCVPHDRKATTT